MKKHDARRLSATVALTVTLCAAPAVAHAAEPQEVQAPEPEKEDAALLDAASGTESADTATLRAVSADAEVPAVPLVEETSPEESTYASLSATASPANVLAVEAVPEEVATATPAADAADAVVPAAATPAAVTAETADSTDAAPAPAASTDEEVSIPDENLHTLIAETLNKGADQKITQQDMAALTKLNAESAGVRNKKIFSLEGLQYAHYLEVLNLNENSVSDLTPISKLANLSELRLVRNEVSDLSPIAQLTKLKVLDFYYNHVTDISAVANFRDLEFLDMHACNRNGAIGSIEPLSGLIKLRYLSIESNQITDISCLKDVAQSMADAVGDEPTDNPPTFLVRVNKIKDFTALKPLLDKEYVELGGIFGSAMDKVIVGTINQSGEAIDKCISAEGGTFEVDLPEILGFEDVDQAIANMFEMDTAKTVVLSEDPEGYSLEVKGGKAYITVDPNVVGHTKHETIRIGIGYEGTDFSYFIPLNITQDVTFAVEQANTKPGRVIGFELNGLKPTSDGSIHFKVTDAAGKTVDLESVNVSFNGKARLGESQEGFVATNVQIENGGFRFDLARKDGVAVSRGTYELRPTISFKVKGDDTTYTLPADMYSIQNVAVTDTPTNIFESVVRFDLTKPNEDGSYTSDEISSEVPFDSTLKIHYVTAYDIDGERLEEVSDDFNPMTLTFTKDQIQRLSYVVLSVSKKSTSVQSIAAAASDDTQATSTSNLYPRLKLELVKPQNSWTHELEFDGWTEGDAENDPLAEAAFGTVAYRYFDANGALLPAKPHAAGTYGVQAYVPEGFAYLGMESGIQQFTIAPAQTPDTPTDTPDSAEDPQSRDGDNTNDSTDTTKKTALKTSAKKSVPQTGEKPMPTALGALTAALAVLASAFSLKGRNSR
ncbi:MAG: leucine-rich repeat domain-containing protein [Atopobiaceae bacterium]|jgi:Leucine-rich repeat (LRR) protein